ncbi:hypothetical protein [Pollutibacter soli]|uniref:hypothetical protein n=1 Tax=Pollutibacter soli TaxID=3034157 RepID=UPI003014070E
MSLARLPFWNFFHELEKKLSYERWIDKYQQFLKSLEGGHVSYDEDWKQFRQFCKFMFLQDFRDERQFDTLLDVAIEKEKIFLESLVAKTSQATDASKIKPEPKKENPSPGSPVKDNVSQHHPQMDNAADTSIMPEPMEQEETLQLQFLPIQVVAHEQQVQYSSSETEFLQTDEYFPVTRRQMVKGWQFLRLKEKSDAREGIDVEETIKQVAKDGLFLNPVYKSGERNREDTLIIFADYRGSMAPFHELTNRLIETARKGGGHPRVPVYYFQNHPVGYVFTNPNMSGPVKIKEALLKTNRNFTLAVVISDAGAARGNSNPERRKSRTEITGAFLDFLDETCAHTIWLNPMPMHRWKGNAAELISKKVFLMAPVLDRYGDKFQETLRTILKHQKPALMN